MDKFYFFIKLSVVFLVFITLIVVKEISVWNFIKQSQEIKDQFVVVNKVFFSNEIALIYYKYLLRNQINTPNITQFEIDKSQLSKYWDYEMASIITANYKLFSPLSDKYQSYIAALVSGDICDIVYGDDPQLAEEWKKCRSLTQSLLARGIENFYLEYELMIKNGIDILEKVYAANNLAAGKLYAQQVLNDPRIHDYTAASKLVNAVLYKWKSVMLDSLDTQISFEKRYSVIFQFVLFGFIILFYVVIWLQLYLDMKEDMFWINNFILLIPMRLFSTNQYLKSYLKRKLKINNIIYI